MGKIERPNFGRPAEAGANVWDVLFRVAALCLGVLLVLAYVTGEEFQHTHVLIGYGLAAVVITTIYWELVRPPQAPLPWLDLQRADAERHPSYRARAAA